MRAINKIREAFRFTYLFCCFLLINSCNINEIGNISEAVNYNPSFSFPFGSDEFTLEDAINEYPGGLYELVDTLNIPDNIETFWYNNSIYVHPGNLDYRYLSDFSLTNITGNTEYIVSLTLRTNARNEIPASAFIQIYFIDGAGFVLDSLYQSGYLQINDAKTDGAGNLLQAAILQEDTQLTENQIQLLAQAVQIQVFGRIVPEEYKATGVHYYSFQSFWLQLGFRVELEMPLNEI